MRLYVYVLEARDIPLLTDAFVKLQVGKYKSRTRVLKKTHNPIWNEEFVFRVHDMDEELIVSVYNHNDDHGFFNGPGDLMGRVRIPIWSVINEDKQTLSPTWFSLEKPFNLKSSMVKDSGTILLTLSLRGRDHSPSSTRSCPAHLKEYAGRAEPSQGIHTAKAPSLKIAEGKHLVKAIGSRLEKLFSKNGEKLKADSKTDDLSDASITTSDYEDCAEEALSSHTFEEDMDLMQSRDDDHEMPSDLPKILLDQTYMVSSRDLNMCLFMPNSQFRRELADQQGITDLKEGSWTWKSGEIAYLTRTVTYMKPASKIVKAVKATEDQTYLKADGSEFAVLVSVSTPDVPYGNCFKIELLYRIVPGRDVALEEESARLIISWNISFLQSTMMRSMIEGGARQGLKESFEQFGNLLAHQFKVASSPELLMDKEHMLASLEAEHQSDWKLAIEYFWNFTVLSTIIMVVYVILHILLSGRGKFPGLEFHGLDLPDTFGELITCSILVVHVERVFNMILHFIQARLNRGSDHGVKSQGDGWMLTVALIEGSDLAAKFYFLLLCFLSYASIPTKSFTLKLIHRDSPESPLYPGNLTYPEKVKRLVFFSESRALYLNSKATNYSSLTKNQTVPIVHPHDLIQPPVANSASSFLYLVQLKFGPSDPYYLVLDTGSDLIWTQCKACEPNCFPQFGTPTLDPPKSKTFRTLPCDHPYCKKPKYTCDNGECKYNIQYLEGYSLGYLGTETLSSTDKDESLLNTIFGCTTASSGLGFEGDIDGILGMSRGIVSLISQMRDETEKFSYCLVDEMKHEDARSYLTFGDNVRFQGSVQSTPFITLISEPDLYGLKLLDISVGNRRLNFPPGTFDMGEDGHGGCFIDSGYAFTTIAEEPYKVFKSAIVEHFGDKLTPIPGLHDIDLCFKIPQDYAAEVPSVTFHFEEEADLIMKSDTVFKYDGTEGYYCLFILPSKSNDFTIIGTLQQVDIRFQYDLGAQRLSWAPEDCHSHP